jgi:hypothetical protein
LLHPAMSMLGRNLAPKDDRAPNVWQGESNQDAAERHEEREHGRSAPMIGRSLHLSEG